MTLADTLLFAGKDYQDCWNRRADEKTPPDPKIGITEMIGAHVAALAWLLSLDADPVRSAENIMNVAMSLPGAVMAQKKRNLQNGPSAGNA